MVHTISIAGTQRQYACAPGDTLLRSGLRAGFGLPYECNAGSCGTCKIDLLSGELADLYPEAPGIKQRDRDRGRRLACQSVPLRDCTINARLDEAYAPRHVPQRVTAILEGVRSVTHDIREFTFRTGVPALFQAGQYAMLSVSGIRAPRAYSMSNTANEDGVWKFMVRRTSGGAMSSALFDLDLRAAAELDGPYGLAFLREDSERDIVCVAGGSGIAPMISILHAAAVHERWRDLGTWLFYGGRGPTDVPAVTEVLGKDMLGSRLEWHPVISVPTLADGTDWGGEYGFVHELLPRKLPGSLANYEYYIAGPPPMIEATVGLLIAEHKVPQAQLHYDRFF